MKKIIKSELTQIIRKRIKNMQVKEFKQIMKEYLTAKKNRIYY